MYRLHYPIYASKEEMQELIWRASQLSTVSEAVIVNNSVRELILRKLDIMDLKHGQMLCVLRCSRERYLDKLYFDHFYLRG